MMNTLALEILCVGVGLDYVAEKICTKNSDMDSSSCILFVLLFHTSLFGISRMISCQFDQTLSCIP